MKRNVSITLLAFTGLLIGACAGDPSINREAAVELPPMEKPTQVWAEIKMINKEDPMSIELIKADGDMITRKVVEGRGAGCTFTYDGWFSPSSSYADCGGDTGTQNFTKTGSIWPLEIGKSEVYNVSGTNGTDSWQTTRRCEVKDAVVVTLGEKQLPSYEVACTDKWSTRTWYVSPELGVAVKYKRYHNQRGLVDDSVLVLE